MENIITLQRATVDEHIRAENAKEWEAVYDTFIQNQSSFFDVIPLGNRFAGISGVKDFYTVIHAAFPDFQITVTGEYDTPGCSIREVTISGKHVGEYCGIAGSGNSFVFELACFFIFGTGSNAGKVLAERVYFDNEILLRQLRGETGMPTNIGLAEISRSDISVKN